MSADQKESEGKPTAQDEHVENSCFPNFKFIELVAFMSLAWRECDYLHWNVAFVIKFEKNKNYFKKHIQIHHFLGDFDCSAGIRDLITP